MQKRKKVPDKPDKKNAIRKAREFILKSGIQWLPVDPLAIYEQYGWYQFTWEEAKVVLDHPDPLFLKKTGAEARTSIPRGTSDIITVWDSSINPKTRIRWTLAHEIGHIVLGHLHFYNETSISRGGLTRKNYQVLEDEADFFAAELLEPMAILKAASVRDVEKIMHVCRVSKLAAQNRYKDIEWHGEDIAIEDAHKMRKQFETYLSYITVCSKCDHLITRYASMDLKEVTLLAEKLPYVTLDKQDRFTRCPRCGNTHFSGEANFCKMCGLYLYNRCGDTPSYNHDQYDDWGHLTETVAFNNPGDARYCEYCGEPTILTNLGLLMSWEEVLEKYGDISAGLAEESLSEVAEKGGSNEWYDLSSEEIEFNDKDIPDDSDEIPF